MREIHFHTRVTPERTSSKEIKLCPSLRSSYRSVMCFLTWNKEEKNKIVGGEGVWGGGREKPFCPVSQGPSRLTQPYWQLSDSFNSGCCGNRGDGAAVTSRFCSRDIYDRVDCVRKTADMMTQKVNQQWCFRETDTDRQTQRGSAGRKGGSR